MEFVVVLYSGRDNNLLQALTRLNGFTRNGVATFASVNCSLLENNWIDPSAEIYSDGARSEVLLLDWLAKNAADLSVLKVLSAVGGEQSPEILELIHNSSVRLIEVVKSMATHIDVQDFRIAFPTYIGEVPRTSFFTTTAKANIIVVARDSASHKSIAKPMKDEGTDEFSSHIAVELSVIFGLWEQMTSCVADLFFPQKNIAEVQVRFISSHTHLLECPPLPINEVVSGEMDLPCPHSYIPVPDPTQAAQSFVNLVFPSDLRFSPTHMPTGSLVDVDGRRFRRQYLKELFFGFLKTPAALFRGIQDQLDEMSGRALQEAVGGSESEISVIFPGMGDNLGDFLITDLYMDQVIGEIAGRQNKPVVSTIGEDSWVEIVSKIIAFADGGDAASEERATFADEKFLLVRVSALAPLDDDVPTLLRELYQGVTVAEQQSELLTSTVNETLDGSMNTVVPVDSEKIEAEDAEFVDEVNPSQVETTLDEAPSMGDEGIWVAQTDGVDRHDMATESQVDESRDTGSTEGVEVIDTPLATAQIIEKKLDATNLLGSLTQVMLDESGAARIQAEHMVNLLKSIPGKFNATPVGRVSNAVKYALAFGISIFYFTTSLTSNRWITNFESGPITEEFKSLLWVMVTTILVFLALAGIVIRSDGKWQGKIIISSTSLVVVLGIEYIYWSSIWDVVVSAKWLKGTTPFAAGLLLLVALVVALFSISRNSLADSKLRKLFARWLAGFTWLYVLVGATAATGSKRSRFWQEGSWSSGQRSNIRNVFLAAGATMMVVSGLVVAFMIVRERYKLDALSRELRWARAELERSADAERRLRLAAAQWIGTAAVVARLFKYPLGREVTQNQEAESNLMDQLSVLKFDHQKLVLTRKGLQGITARVRQLFIAKNWLGRQYHQMIISFKKDSAFEQGLNPDEDFIPRPEACSAVPTIDEILDGRARGPRWTFLKNVYKGDYDKALLETTDEVHLESAYSTIVLDRESHSVGNKPLITPEFFERLIPDKEIRIPTGLVTTLFKAGDESQLMTAHIWWPNEFLSIHPTGRSLNFYESEVLRPQQLTDPIQLFGSCVMVSEEFLLTNVAAGMPQS